MTVKGSNKGLIQLGQDVVGQIVAAMLNVLQLLYPGVDVLKVIQNLLKQPGAVPKIAGHVSKHVKETSLGIRRTMLSRLLGQDLNPCNEQELSHAAYRQVNQMRLLAPWLLALSSNLGR